MTRDFEALENMFGAYFHQDWPDEYVTDEDAIAAMIDDVQPEYYDRTSSQLEDLLSIKATESEFREIMAKIGCYFEPASKGQTYREWLGGVSRQWQAKVSRPNGV